MQFTSTQDVNAPIDFVFNQVADFENFEGYAMRVGAQVERLDTLTEKGAGMTWNVVGDFRNKTRNVDIKLMEYQPNNTLRFLVNSKGVEAKAQFEILPLTRKQTRMKITADIKPLSISARLILQSARLARNSLNRKFNHRFWTFATFIEDNYNKSMRT